MILNLINAKTTLNRKGGRRKRKGKGKGEGKTDVVNSKEGRWGWEECYCHQQGLVCFIASNLSWFPLENR